MNRLFYLTAAALVAGLPALAVAGMNEHVPPVRHAPTAKECGECHMAFQPALLPAESWGRIMDGLADHFGDNASLPADAAAEIRAYLTANAGGGDGREMRITAQRWFVREHKFRTDPRHDAKIRSPANCAACHPGAARGEYEDD